MLHNQSGLGEADAVALAAQLGAGKWHQQQDGLPPGVWEKLATTSSGHSDGSHHHQNASHHANSDNSIRQQSSGGVGSDAAAQPPAAAPASPSDQPDCHAQSPHAAAPPAAVPLVKPEHLQLAGDDDADARARLAAAAGPPPSLPPPPSPSEGPQAAAEYESYATRWAAGTTLAQRWHRLAASGRLGELRADWEEWQHDLALQQLQAAIQQQGKAPRRRRDEAEVDADAPRQTRQRRAPSSLHDYQVEAPTAAGPGGMLGGIRPDDQQPQRSSKTGAGGCDDDGDASYSDGCEGEPRARAQAGGRGRQGGGQGRGASRAAQQQQYARQQQQQAQQQWGHWAPQQQQAAQAQQQQAQQLAQLQEAMGMAGSAGSVRPELASALFNIGNAFGAALQQQVGSPGRGAPGSAAAPLPAVMMEMCARMLGGVATDPAAFSMGHEAMAQQ